MKQYAINNKNICDFRLSLIEEEKSPSTIDKYLRDIRAFSLYCEEKTLSKQTVIQYKQSLIASGYSIRSANSMLAALNSFFHCMGWDELKIRYLKLQKQIYRPQDKELTKEEYKHLCRIAEESNNMRLSLLIQTLCCTGIRVSELHFITWEALQLGEAEVTDKGKSRIVFIVPALRQKLIAYCRSNGIAAGPVFITRSGKMLERTYIWREMKALCRKAGVNPEKVYPHNLRHLFAREFYSQTHDIAKLADVLGHSSVETTRIYIMSTGEEHRKMMEKMDLTL